MKIRFPTRVTLRSLTVSMESGVKIVADKASKVFFGKWNYVSRLANIEVYDGGEIRFGDRIFFNKNFSVVSRYKITIGNDCQFGPNVCVYDHSHSYGEDVPISKQGYHGAPIVIGNNVWIGAGCFIKAGTTIGDNSVIGANTLVINDVEENSVICNKVEMLLL